MTTNNVLAVKKQTITVIVSNTAKCTQHFDSVNSIPIITYGQLFDRAVRTSYTVEILLNTVHRWGL